MEQTLSGTYLPAHTHPRVFSYLGAAQKTLSEFLADDDNAKNKLTKTLDHLVGQILRLYEDQFRREEIRSLGRKGCSVESAVSRSSTSESPGRAMGKMRELERRVDNSERQAAGLRTKVARLQDENLKMRVDFLKQLQHLKEMAHRNETLPDFTFLEVKFFSAEDGFDEHMLFLLNQRLGEVRDQYNRRMVALQKTNAEVKKKVEHFELLCADGNYGIPFKEMGTESILRKLAIIENNPFIVWRHIELFFGSGFFNDVILKEYDINQPGYQNDITSQLDDYERKAKQHLKSISSQSQVEIALLRKCLKDKEVELMDVNQRIKEAVSTARQEERHEAELRNKELRIMLEQKFEHERIQVTPGQGSLQVDVEQLDKLRLRNAISKWWFKATLGRINSARDEKTRFPIIGEAENELRKKEIAQLAAAQEELAALKQECYEFKRKNTELSYELGQLRRAHDRRSMEHSQIVAELATIQRQYKDVLNEKMSFENSSHQLLKSAEAQRAYILNMERELFDLEKWITRVCALDRTLRPPQALVSRTKQKQLAETANKKAVKELYDETVSDLSKLEKDRYRDKEVLTLMHGLNAQMDLVMPEETRPTLEVETQTPVKYSVQTAAQTGKELIGGLKDQIPEVKQEQEEWQRVERKLKAEIRKAKERIDQLRTELMQESERRAEAEQEVQNQRVKMRESERLDRINLIEEIKRGGGSPLPLRREVTMRDQGVQSNQIESWDQVLHTYETDSQLETVPENQQQLRNNENIVVQIHSRTRSDSRTETPSSISNPSPIEQGAPALRRASIQTTPQPPTKQVMGQTEITGEADSYSPSPRSILLSPAQETAAGARDTLVHRRVKSLRVNMSKREQRPVFKVVPYGVGVIEKMFERRQPPLRDQGVQTYTDREVIISSGYDQSVASDSSPGRGGSMVEELMSLAEERSRHYQPSSFKNCFSSSNLRRDQGPFSEKNSSRRLLETEVSSPPPPPPLENMHVANFLMNASERTRHHSMHNSSSQQLARSLVTVSHHQKMKLGRLRQWGALKNLPDFSLTNLTLQPTNNAQKKKAAELQQNFQQRLKRPLWLQKRGKKPKEVEKEQASKIGLRIEKSKTRFKSVLLSQGAEKRYMLLDSRQASQVSATSFFPLYDGGESSMESSRMKTTTIKFESPPIINVPPSEEHSYQSREGSSIYMG